MMMAPLMMISPLMMAPPFRYKEAAQYRDLLTNLDRESKRLQSLASEQQSKAEPKLRLGKRVLHKDGGFR